MRVFFTFLLLAALAVGGWLAWALYSPVTPVGQTFVLLHPGYSTRRIAAELKSAGVIRSTNAFLVWHRLHRGRSLKAGEYLFERPATALEIHDRLARGDIFVHTVVIPEGFNMFEIAQAIEGAGLGPSQDFLKVAQSDTALISDFAPDAKSTTAMRRADRRRPTRRITRPTSPLPANTARSERRPLRAASAPCQTPANDR